MDVFWFHTHVHPLVHEHLRNGGAQDPAIVNIVGKTGFLVTEVLGLALSDFFATDRKSVV